MADGAEYYTVEGVTEQGRTVSCMINDTYCALYNLDCGQLYNVSITANNHACKDVSTSTETAMIKTGEKKTAITSSVLHWREDAFLHLSLIWSAVKGECHN